MKMEVPGWVKGDDAQNLDASLHLRQTDWKFFEDISKDKIVDPFILPKPSPFAISYQYHQIYQMNIAKEQAYNLFRRFELSVLFYFWWAPYDSWWCYRYSIRVICKYNIYKIIYKDDSNWDVSKKIHLSKLKFFI